MTVLYVQQQGAVVRRHAEQIQVIHKQQVLSSLSVREVEQVVLYGNVQITTQAAALLLQHQVDVVFLSYRGSYRGRLSQGGARYARLRHAQLQLSGDEARSLEVARHIVKAKLRHQIDLLGQLADQVPTQASELQRAAAGIDQMRRTCERASNLDELRGYEGKAGVYYFGGLRRLLNPRWGFDGRKYHPPPDPFNALLSFGYSLLLKDVTAIIEIVGLDPYMGCFHALEYGRPSLALDLMEEFRPLAVDPAMLRLVLDGTLTPERFTFTGSSRRPVELGPELIPIVIEAYERRMNETVAYGPREMAYTLRYALEQQARKFARMVLSGRSEFTGVAGR
ncbi:MAG: CRISPR-associated endonuclease Cas1 [Anaerolineae bacterium]